MKSKLLLHLLTARTAARRDGGSVMVAGILVVLALGLGTLALASFFSGALLGTRGQGARGDAEATAEAGMNRVMAVLNEPVNRRILVSGQAMGNWQTVDFTSPCRDAKNQSPGAPSSEARSFGDGQFRDLETLAVNAGSRQFRVTQVTYAAGLPGADDRRSQSVTTTAGSATTTKVGSFSEDLINLEKTGDKQPGFNKGFITVTVEGKVVQGGNVSVSTITREYEVVPRCCGASFGSNNSGGIQLNNADSLGADSRLCGVEFGMIVGINGGTAWQNAANDRFTKRLPNGTVVNISNVLGIVSKDGDQFSRATFRMRPNAQSTTVPDPCDPARWAGGTCGSARWVGLRNATPNAFYGTQADIDGTAYSGVPIIASALTLPTIGNQVTTGKYNFVWTSGSGPAKRVDPSDDGGQRYVTLNPSGASGFRFRFRTRNDTTPPRVEVCNESPSSIGGNGNCTNSSWTPISGNAGTSENPEPFTMSAPNSTVMNSNQPQGDWETLRWTQIDQSNGRWNNGRWNNGRVQLRNQRVEIGVGGSMNALRNGFCRMANLAGNLGRATLSFKQSGNNVQAGNEIWVQVSTSGSDNCSGDTADTTADGDFVTVAKFAGVNNAVTRVVSLADYQSPTTRIRIINGTSAGSSAIHYIDDVNLRLSDWCEYSANSPASAAPGFHCLGPRFNLSVDTGVWTSSPAGGQVYIDTTRGPLSFYYTRTDDLRGSSFTDVNPTTYTNPLISVGNGGFLRLVECAGSTPSNNCTTPVPETDVALVGDPDNLNFFGRDAGPEQIVNFGIVASSSGFGRISGAWFYMPQGYFEMKSYGCAGYNPPGSGPNINLDDSWIFNGRIWTKHFKPCGDIHIRVPPSSGSNLGAVVASSNVFSDLITYVPWTGIDWVARTVTQSRRY
jgi:hypothetical protein